MGIRDLTGLEHAANLTSLSLGYNLIVDISPLAGLTQLETLSLDHNSIADISPLAGLTQLDLRGLTITRSGYFPISRLNPIEAAESLGSIVEFPH